MRAARTERVVVFFSPALSEVLRVLCEGVEKYEFCGENRVYDWVLRIK